MLVTLSVTKRYVPSFFKSFLGFLRQVQCLWNSSRCFSLFSLGKKLFGLLSLTILYFIFFTHVIFQPFHLLVFWWPSPSLWIERNYYYSYRGWLNQFTFFVWIYYPLCHIGGNKNHISQIMERPTDLNNYVEKLVTSLLFQMILN